MSDHLDLETLAEFAEGSLPPGPASEARKHLAACRSCTAAFADAVRYRAAWLAAPEMFVDSTRPVGELLAAARLSQPDRRRATSPTRSRALLGATAAGAAVVAGTLWALRLGSAPTLGFELPLEVRATTEWSSSRGFVLPGGENFAAGATPVLRSGLAEPSTGLTHELDSLTTAYEASRPSAEVAARLVTALLAVNDVSAAGDYSREALRHDPNDARLLVLSAAASYRNDDLGAAEQSLRVAHGHAGRDPLVAFDLALVLRARGEPKEARRLFEDVVHSRCPALASRSRRELQSH